MFNCTHEIIVRNALPYFIKRRDNSKKCCDSFGNCHLHNVKDMGMHFSLFVRLYNAIFDHCHVQSTVKKITENIKYLKINHANCAFDMRFNLKLYMQQSGNILPNSLHPPMYPAQKHVLWGFIIKWHTSWHIFIFIFDRAQTLLRKSGTNDRMKWHYDRKYGTSLNVPWESCPFEKWKKLMWQ